MARSRTQAVLELERRLLEHVARYRLTVPQALWGSLGGDVPDLSGIKRHLQRMVREEKLAAAPLYHNRRYYHLPENLLSRLEPGDVHTGPLSEESKIRAYAMLAFCCLLDRPRSHLTKTEFQQHFPNLDRPGRPMNYYVDWSVNPARLGFLRTDRGGSGRWDRIIDKVRRDAESHWRDPGFRPLLEQSRFEVSLVTALPQKAERIRRVLEESPPHERVPVHVAEVPELMNLIAPAPVPD